MSDVAGVRALVQVTLARYRDYEAWLLGLSEPKGPPEEFWPRYSETEIIEKEVLALVKMVYGDERPQGWEPHESYQKRYAGNVQKAYDENTIVADPGDGNSPYKKLLKATARATILWLQHTLDFLVLLGSSAPKAINQPLTDPTANFERKVILFLAANPSDHARLNQEREVSEIRKKLRGSKHEKEFDLQSRGACNRDDFITYVVELKPVIVQFSGHGSSGGAIYLEGEDGKSREVSETALASLFKLVSGSVECVVLNACYAEQQARAISLHIPFVVGMRSAISDDAAINFSKGFYLAIANGDDYKTAFDTAVTMINFHGSNEQDTPVLLSSETSI